MIFVSGQSVEIVIEEGEETPAAPRNKSSCHAAAKRKKRIKFNKPLVLFCVGVSLNIFFIRKVIVIPAISYFNAFEGAAPDKNVRRISNI